VVTADLRGYSCVPVIRSATWVTTHHGVRGSRAPRWGITTASAALQGVLDGDQRGQDGGDIRVDGVDDVQPVFPRQCFIGGRVVGAVQENNRPCRWVRFRDNARPSAIRHGRTETVPYARGPAVTVGP
jgi:hypothetical protein